MQRWPSVPLGETKYCAWTGVAGIDSAIAQSVDKHVGGIRGRKRGLLNVPYWVVEHVLLMVYGLHIGFSSMDREHQRSFLRRSMLRLPRERARSFVPELAELARMR